MNKVQVQQQVKVAVKSSPATMVLTPKSWDMMPARLYNSIKEWADYFGHILCDREMAVIYKTHVMIPNKVFYHWEGNKMVLQTGSSEFIHDICELFKIDYRGLDKIKFFEMMDKFGIVVEEGDGIPEMRCEFISKKLYCNIHNSYIILEGRTGEIQEGKRIRINLIEELKIFNKTKFMQSKFMSA